MTRTRASEPRKRWKSGLSMRMRVNASSERMARPSIDSK